MPMKLNVGLTKKLGMPHYSSIAASCYLELELDQSMVFLDLDAFYERVRQAYAVCRQSVAEEFAHQRNGASGGESRHRPTRTTRPTASTVPSANRTGPPPGSSSATCSDWPSRFPA